MIDHRGLFSQISIYWHFKYNKLLLCLCQHQHGINLQQGHFVYRQLIAKLLLPTWQLIIPGVQTGSIIDLKDSEQIRDIIANLQSVIVFMLLVSELHI